MRHSDQMVPGIFRAIQVYMTKYDKHIKLPKESVAENQSVLTACIAVQQKRVLELEVQVFGDWLCQVLHAESVHNGETMSGRCQSEGREGK